MKLLIPNSLDMREVKFRAVFTNDGGEKVVSTNSFTIEELASYEEHEWEFSDGSTLPANDVEDGDLEYIEYTGLKDAKGVDIYFDDIVELEGCKAIVKFDNTIFALYLDPLDEDNWCEDWEADDLCRFEVIGNTYQHKHLLNDN